MQNLDALSPADRKLVQVAADHAKERYIEKFVSIGGALRTVSGNIYTGINLKYRTRNTSTCAETMAIYKALDQGDTKLDTVVGVKYLPETDSYEVVNGCGWCRQLYCYNVPLKVIVDNNGKLEVWEAEDMLPLAFL